MIFDGDARSLWMLNDRSVRLVVTSPPYLALRDYGHPGEIGQESSPVEYVAELMKVLDECARVLTPDGSLFMVIGDKYARTGGVDRKVRGVAAGDPGGRSHVRLPQKGLPGVPNGSLAGLPFRVALAAIDAGWIWRQEIVWHKPNPLPESVTNRCTRSHETILHLTRKASGYYSAAAERVHDVWDIPVGTYRDAQGRRHPAVFPETLVERIVRGWSEAGDTVLDPFAGSGTTVVVANRLGRKGLGVELNPEWASVARDRLAPIVTLH
jgi:DNA modification methylase